MIHNLILFILLVLFTIFVVGILVSYIIINIGKSIIKNIFLIIILLLFINKMVELLRIVTLI